MNVAFRVDASRDIGTGHFIRCLTLADALRTHGVTTRFVSARLPANLAALVERHGHVYRELAAVSGAPVCDGLHHSTWLPMGQAADAQAALAALSDVRWDWLVVDHYALDIRWETKLRAVTRHILAIDDLADRVHDCDALVDQNLYTNACMRYRDKVPAHCECLLGPRYALLRYEFHEGRQTVRKRSGSVRRILIALGGIDAENWTTSAIDAIVIAGLKNVSVDVVIGSMHPYLDVIKARCAAYGYACHIDARNMAELMAAADLAIGAGGSTSWERCCMGLPTLAISLALNQDDVVDGLARAGLVLAPKLGSDRARGIALQLSALVRNPMLLQTMSQNAWDAVDGEGVKRVLRALDCAGISIRLACPEDSKQIFEWRNDPSIRAVSRRQGIIQWPEHERWFGAALSSPVRHILVGERAGVPIGVVRFDIEGPVAEVSIFLRPDLDRSGLGAPLLCAAESWLKNHRSDVEAIGAEVMRGNERSRHLFEATGYDIDRVNYIKAMRRI